MPPDQIARIIWILLALMLVGSGLIGRRLSWAKSLNLAAIWLGIFIAIWAVISVVQGGL